MNRLTLRIICILTLSSCTQNTVPKSHSVMQPIVPPDGFISDAILGETLYDQHCEDCHGRQGKGTELGPALVHPAYIQQYHPNLSFFLAVRKGVKSAQKRFSDMPAMPQVSAEEAAHIVKYIREKQLEAGIYKNNYKRIPSYLASNKSAQVD